MVIHFYKEVVFYASIFLFMVIMKRSLGDISTIPSAHKVGLKRVPLAAEESACAITQIAITDLKADEVERCEAEDFVWIEHGTSHELRAVTVARILMLACGV